MIVPFKTPLDYWKEPLQQNPENINRWHEIQKTYGWQYDNDLHIYPYNHAQPVMLSMGCKNLCYFCPSAQHFKGKVYYGNPEIILPHYQNQNVHFMDEDFFNNDMDLVLPLLERYKIKWLAMTTNTSLQKVVEQYGEKKLFKSGLRIVEVGLENVALMFKCQIEVKLKKIAIYYLNLCLLPKETKETIAETTQFMKKRSLKHPIHYNNGLWYATGQFYYTYGQIRADGIEVESKYARTRPTYIPNSLLDQDFKVINLEKVNYYSQLVFGYKNYNPPKQGSIRELADSSQIFWLIIGLKTNGII